MTGIKIHFVVLHLARGPQAQRSGFLLHLARGPQVAHPCFTSLSFTTSSSADEVYFEQDMTEADLKDEQQSVVEHFKQQGVTVDTLVFLTVSTHKGSGDGASSVTTVTGDGVIYEKIFDLQFRVSSEAFFQVSLVFLSHVFAKV